VPPWILEDAVVSRRSVLVQTIRRNAKKQGAPIISVCGGWGGREPFAVYSLNHRKPTEAEIAAAIAAWKRERDKQRAKQQSNNVAAHEKGATPEETEA
jgi:hypothetical protein